MGSGVGDVVSGAVGARGSNTTASVITWSLEEIMGA